MARLLIDTMCGGLPAYLRLCGHDTAYAPDRDVVDDEALLDLARAEDRTIVTRDRELARRASDACLLTARETDAQLAELAAGGIDLRPEETPIRCGRCNGPLDRVECVDPDRVPDYVPDALTASDENAPGERSLWRCGSCGQYFWKGSHWDRMCRTLESVR